MHKSKLAGFIIDCRTDRDGLPAMAEFWGQALGMPTQALPEEEGERYIRLDDPHDRLHVEVQAVDHPSRVHLDIETDNIPAEVERLQRLGARRVDAIHGWAVMEAPSGQRFCVVRNRSTDFERLATQWP